MKTNIITLLKASIMVSYKKVTFLSLALQEIENRVVLDQAGFLASQRRVWGVNEVAVPDRNPAASVHALTSS